MTKLGIIAGNFDVIHPGYIYMFQEAAENCDKLLIALHSDPSIERPEKIKPILSIEERRLILSCLKSIDMIIVYTYEHQLETLIKNTEPHIRFL